MRVDLHLHTTASDGAWTPQAVVQGAVDGRLDVIAITDHDTMAGYEPAAAAAEKLPIQIIRGIEVSSTHEGQDVHILGYFVDPESPVLIAHCERAGNRRVERMQEMVAKLVEGGLEVTYDDVLKAAGPDHVSIGRPHLARALVELGHVSTVSSAFNSLIGDNHAAFVPTHLASPVEAVGMIVEAGGVPIWAHPPGWLVDELLPGLVGAGLGGLEVYRPSHRKHDVVRYETICRTGGLLMSGGSDWHTPFAGASLGDFHVEASEIEPLLSEGGF
jgi:predicted metal-dependent phosphoesterase TrpH